MSDETARTGQPAEHLEPAAFAPGDVDLAGRTGQSEGQVVAMYESAQEAQTAQSHLASGGVPAGSIQILDEEGTGAPPPRSEADQGLWGAFIGLFMPNEDALTYQEGVRRGHAVLIVNAAADQHDKVINLLHETSPIDLDERQAAWRQSGWAGVPQSALGSGASAGSVVTPSPNTDSKAAQATGARAVEAAGGGTGAGDPHQPTPLATGVGRFSGKARSYVRSGG